MACEEATCPRWAIAGCHAFAPRSRFSTSVETLALAFRVSHSSSSRFPSLEGGDAQQRLVGGIMESSLVEGLEAQDTAGGSGRGRVKVKVLLFAMARELAGVPELDMVVAEGVTTDECVTVVVRRFPALQAVQEAMVLALNQAYVGEPLVLKDGDELAFIPPISGG